MRSYRQKLKVAVTYKVALSLDLNKLKLMSWLKLTNSNSLRKKWVEVHMVFTV